MGVFLWARYLCALEEALQKAGMKGAREGTQQKHSQVHLQGYLAHKELRPLRTLAGLCLGPYGSRGGGTVSYERGTP
jgi:hypothetical protein